MPQSGAFAVTERAGGSLIGLITMKKKHKPSLFEDVVEYPPKPRQGPSVWTRWANAFALIGLIATGRWLKPRKPAD